jgi:hypothetical protein
MKICLIKERTNFLMVIRSDHNKVTATNTHRQDIVAVSSRDSVKDSKTGAAVVALECIEDPSSVDGKNI